MSKTIIAACILLFGLLMGNGWKNAGGIVYDKINQTQEVSK